MRLIHTFDDRVDLYHDEQLLFSYVYQPQTVQLEAPRPYFHPLCTLAGDTVTNFRPNDHRWHHGLSMTFAYLSGQNFWGGVTYVRDHGYQQLNNNGRQQHITWGEMTTADNGVILAERLTWLTEDGEEWIDEVREIRVPEVNTEKGYWMLDISMKLRNIRSESLLFGSPTTEGRHMAGYGGLSWRGARDLHNGQLMLAGGETATDDDTLMGQSAQWIAYTGVHDGVDRASTVVFVDKPSNPRYPNRWFSRTQGYAGVSFAFMFDEYYELPAGDELALAYRVIIANGAWSHADVEAAIK